MKKRLSNKKYKWEAVFDGLVLFTALAFVATLFILALRML